jgi:membrane protease YdiL (CAAX protease family)
MPLVAEREISPDRRAHLLPAPSGRAHPPLLPYSGAVVVGLLLMTLFGGLAYAITAALVAVAVFLYVYVTGHRPQRTALFHRRVDQRDLLAILGIYAIVIAFYRVAFVVIDNNDMLLFLSFAAGLLVGVAGPVIYTVWMRERSLASLGLSLTNLPRVAALALVFAAVQFSITLWGYELPGTRDWVTLVGMALMVGVFESVFFRGFVQGRLQASFGAAPAVFGAALLYGWYHFGYGMGLEEMFFLSGLGIVYALAYLTVENVLVLWPLLTPLGSVRSARERRTRGTPAVGRPAGFRRRHGTDGSGHLVRSPTRTKTWHRRRFRPHAR